MEFITANRTYDRCIKDFGSSIVAIKKLGWYTRLVFAGMKKGMVIKATRHPVLLRVDTSKVSLRQRNDGTYMLGTAEM
jgi:hypothetical protein